ncbi:unnamed protein product [Ranitomeya imitator]|uniref:Uncharacterized protein n=1 Tax=Ranitomeya imitator TaxID=111125 RepID=A0ABN9LL80_9NEOB|nr:unnamed protein product [Ranitomeya imitator]
MVFKLPLEKVENLKDSILQVSSAKKVIPIGRGFSMRLSLTTRGVSQLHHFVRVTRNMKEDLAVWGDFLQSFNGMQQVVRVLLLFLEIIDVLTLGLLIGKRNISKCI